MIDQMKRALAAPTIEDEFMKVIAYSSVHIHRVNPRPDEQVENEMEKVNNDENW